MNLEGLTLKFLTDKLKQELLGSKIYRVFMPNPHAVLLLLRRSRDTIALLGDNNSGSPALYIPEKMPENPNTPQPFVCFCVSTWKKDALLKSVRAV